MGRCIIASFLSLFDSTGFCGRGGGTLSALNRSGGRIILPKSNLSASSNDVLRSTSLRSTAFVCSKSVGASFLFGGNSRALLDCAGLTIVVADDGFDTDGVVVEDTKIGAVDDAAVDCAVDDVTVADDAVGVVAAVVTDVDIVFITSAIVDVTAVDDAIPSDGVGGLIVVIDEMFSRRTGTPVLD